MGPFYDVARSAPLAPSPERSDLGYQPLLDDDPKDNQGSADDEPGDKGQERLRSNIDCVHTVREWGYGKGGFRDRGWQSNFNHLSILSAKLNLL